MWVIPSLILLFGVTSMVVFASHPPSPVLVAFAPDENPTAAQLEKSIAKTMKKAAVKQRYFEWRRFGSLRRAASAE
jgi:hypothetical protein